MNRLFALICLSFTASALAGESGYILNGKTTIVYKDGNRVGEYPSSVQSEEKTARKPSAATSTDNKKSIQILMYEDDGFARCYSWGNPYAVRDEIKYTTDTTAINCIKK